MEISTQLIFFGCLIPAIILHEISHGVVALRFGDTTARDAGRLTLNPIPHIDPFGTILLPAILVLLGGAAFGWAKPVPVNAARMYNPRRDLLLSTLAGPATNFVLMAIAAVAARAVFSSLSPQFWVTYEDIPLVPKLLLFFALANMLLGVFNLLPIPPLDGSALIERVLPREWLPAWYKFRPYGLLVLIVLVFWTGIIGRILDPFIEALFEYILGS